MTINLSPAARALTAFGKMDKAGERAYIERAKFQFFRRDGGVVACYGPGAPVDAPFAFYAGERFGRRIPATAADWRAHKARRAERLAAKNALRAAQ